MVPDPPDFGSAVIRYLEFAGSKNETEPFSSSELPSTQLIGLLEESTFSTLVKPHLFGMFPDGDKTVSFKFGVPRAKDALFI
jgi:hypothetical protein